MYKNMYHNVLIKSLSKKKTNWWCPGRKISGALINKKLVIPKGLFFRVCIIKPTQIGIITGSLVSTRKPFNRPIKSIRR